MNPENPLKKTATGIPGLDEITSGGLPRGRPTLVCGGAGCGKSLLAMEFLVRGATQFGEPGVYFTFEENPEDVIANFSSLDFKLPELIEKGLIRIEHIEVEASALHEAGEYDLEALFVRLEHATRKIGAKSVVFDTIEALFGGISNHVLLRAELHRLFRWIKEKEFTAIVTGERGEGPLTRQGLEEYVSDCVILMDHRVSEQLSTRRLRIVKYRGSLHGTNEYPFMIDESGVTILPVTALKLEHPASTERVSSGVPKLDAMLGGKGYFRGSTVLISGHAGSGKTSLAAHFVNTACRNGERCLYFAFEESPAQLTRNMRSIGVDLGVWEENGLLTVKSSRPTFHGLEMHLVNFHKLVERIEPKHVIIDPISSLTSMGSGLEVEMMITRLIDFLKGKGITILITSLTSSGSPLETTEMGISEWIDTWLLLKEIESSGERNRGMYIIKSRGMAHSNQVREFVLTDRGVDLVDVYLGPAGVLTGSARVAQEAREKAAYLEKQRALARDRLKIEQRRSSIASQIQSLEAELAILETEEKSAVHEHEQVRKEEAEARAEMAESRSLGEGEKAA